MSGEAAPPKEGGERRGRKAKSDDKVPQRVVKQARDLESNFDTWSAELVSSCPTDPSRQVKWLTRSVEGKFGCILCIQRRKDTKDAGGSKWSKCTVGRLHNRNQGRQHAQQSCHIKSVNHYWFGADAPCVVKANGETIACVGFGKGLPTPQDVMLAHAQALKASSAESIAEVNETLAYASKPVFLKMQAESSQEIMSGHGRSHTGQ